MNRHTMNKRFKPVLLGLSLPLLLSVTVSPEAPLGVGFMREAVAVIGRPLTPVSYAGVARRTTRRTVYAGTAAAATTAAATTTVTTTTATAPPPQEAAPEPAPAPAPEPAPAAAPAGAPPLGSMVSTLPSGCAATTINNVQYFKCESGAYYRAAFQGNNLVYVVTQP